MLYASYYISVQQGSGTQWPFLFLPSHRIFPMERPLYTFPSRAKGLPLQENGDVPVMNTEDFPGDSPESPTSCLGQLRPNCFTLENSIEAVLAALICAWSHCLVTESLLTVSLVLPLVLSHSDSASTSRWGLSGVGMNLTAKEAHVRRVMA